MKALSPLLIVLLFLLAPAAVFARQSGGSDQDVNVNSRYAVEKVSVEGIDEDDVGKSLRADMQKLVGQKYDQAAVNDLTERLRKDFRGYSVDAKVRRGETKDHVRVMFQFERRRNAFDVQAAPLVYHSDLAFSAVLGFDVEAHHNYASVNWTTTSDELIERYEGWRLRYEHRRVGTSIVQLGVGFDYFHPSFLAPTVAALALSPDVPGTYRVRRDFAPSVSVLPTNGVKVTAGLSLQNLDFDAPAPRSARAYAFTLDAQVDGKMVADGGIRQAIGVDYSLRKATPTLESEFVYTRHLVAGDYTLSRHRHLFGFHGRLGTISGDAPLFERFSIGNTHLLRGWNKFDVAPLGGSRLAYGSLEYHYRPFQIFWDFGSVWDANRAMKVRHGIGVGFGGDVGHDGQWFASLAFPVRLHDVGPVFMIGIRR